MNKLLGNKKFKLGLIIVSFILMNVSTIYILYALSLLSGIENLIRLLVAIILVLIALICNISYLRKLKSKKNKYMLLFIFTLVYSVGLMYGANFVIKTYKAVDSMTSSSTTYSTSLVVLKDSKVKDISSLGNGKIGLLADSTSIDGNQIPNEIIEDKNIKNEVVEYENYILLIQSLYSKEIDYAFLPTNYVVMFQNMDGANLENIGEETKKIYTETKEVKKEIENKSTNLEEPFAVLIMGVDSENEEIAGSSFNGDSLMLLTFNPETLNTTILSIPRDTYVPIMCFDGHRKNKITHAAWYGEECMISTIENYTGINIDYYVKINFKGVVKLVDALGGVEVDVPYSFCEQNSNRAFGSETVFVKKGLQVLNGEQALAFSRNRHTWPDICGPEYSNYVSNDFIRGQNQQTVLRSLLNKLKEIKSINKVTELMDTISKSMETNMTTSEIFSLYNVAKDILVKSNGSDMDELIGIQRLYLNGTDSYIYDAGSGLNLYNYVVYEESLEAVANAMKVNLNLMEPEIIKNFAFSIDEEYETEVIGKNIYGTSSVKKLPSFVGDTESQAKNKASRLGISVNFKYVTTGSGTNNTVISQNYAEGYDLTYVKAITLTVLKEEEKTETKVEEKTVETKETTEKKTDTTEKTENNTTEKEVPEEKTTEVEQKDEKESSEVDEIITQLE